MVSFQTMVASQEQDLAKWIIHHNVDGGFFRASAIKSFMFSSSARTCDAIHFDHLGMCVLYRESWVEPKFIRIREP